MATIGGNVYAESVHKFFDAFRNYDLDGALAVLADDADLVSPWGNGTGHEAIRAALEPVVAPGMDRPSFTIKDISGDGNVTTLTVSMSGRFGRGPKTQTWKVLHLHGIIHQVHIA